MVVNRTGVDCRLTGSITKLLGDQISTLSIWWTITSAFPESATHPIDFGPGDSNGRPLNARNYEGRGMRVIVVGDKGKGNIEQRNVRHV
jgi:fatty acid synthase subunit alpha, fungi type